MTDMPHVFIGYDPRQPLAYNTLQHSILRHASKPVSITALVLKQLPITRRGLTEFTFSRFLVPYLCGYKGTAVFMDADIVVTGDICELFEQSQPLMAVQVMKNQANFEWPSVLLFNCALCKMLTPEFVDDGANQLFDLAWAKDRVGTFSDEWNHCVGYSENKEAKLYHYTQGIPAFWETSGLPEDVHWNIERKALTDTVSWKELMGRSIHAKPVLQRMLKRYV